MSLTDQHNVKGLGGGETMLKILFVFNKQYNKIQSDVFAVKWYIWNRGRVS